MNVSLCAWVYQVLYVLLLFVLVSSRLFHFIAFHSFIHSFVGWFSPSLRLAADAVKSTLAK